MEAFFYANHTSQILDSVSTPGHRLVGQLELDPGSYLVFAKADIGTNVASGYPPPPWPHGGGAMSLTLGGSNDVAYAAIKPESGSNIESIALMVAAEISTTRHARLYFLAPWPLRTVVNSVRLAALKVDKLKIVEVGTDHTTLPEEKSKSIFVEFAMHTGIHLRNLGKIKDDD